MAGLKLSSLVRLRDGVNIPLLGLGLYQAKRPGTVNTIKHALGAGYRLLDCPELYQDEEACGKAIRDSGVAREEIFVTSKVWFDSHGFDETHKAFKYSIQMFGLDYIDMYMIHSPIGGKILKTYEAMLHNREQGHIRTLGVSNFNIHHFEGIRHAGLPLPSVNQVELHPFLSQEEIVNYCKENKIAVMGYSPLAMMTREGDANLQAIAKKHNKTEAQVMIRWSLECGYITIPRSCTKEHVLSNSQVFDFELDDQDYDLISQLPDHRCTWDSSTEQWAG